MSEFYERPKPTQQENRIAIFLLLIGVSLVLNMFLVWIENLLGLSSAKKGLIVFHILFSMGYYVFPILIAWQLPQKWIRISATIIFSIFGINSMLSTMGLPNLYKLFLNPEPFEYFQF